MKETERVGFSGTIIDTSFLLSNHLYVELAEPIKGCSVACFFILTAICNHETVEPSYQRFHDMLVVGANVRGMAEVGEVEIINGELRGGKIMEFSSITEPVCRFVPQGTAVRANLVTMGSPAGGP